MLLGHHRLSTLPTFQEPSIYFMLLFRYPKYIAVMQPNFLYIRPFGRNEVHGLYVSNMKFLSDDAAELSLW